LEQDSLLNAKIPIRKMRVISNSQKIISNKNQGMRIAAIIALSLLALNSVGCGGGNSNEKQVFAIKGTVTVDGKPVEQIQVALHDKAGLDNKQPTYPQGFTDAQGNIRISTYADGDGAPAGEYNVTFTWQEYNLMSRGFSGPDKLNKKYSDPKTASFSVTLGPGKPNDMGKVELTTKK
jgi:5-hydroxyisourate hydrolase-like protein (transthyretin family)